MTPVLELHGVWAGYGPFQALFDVSFTVEPGGRLEVAFLCSTLLERGGTDSPELRIHADLAAGATALVSVSATRPLTST